MGDSGEDEFSEFLARERTHGVLEQEAGEFQIDHLKAMKKQASFSLPEPGLWLVKMVQAAVASGAEEVKIRLLRRKVIVHFPNRAQWKAETLVEILYGNQPNQDKALFHLKSGLMAASENFTQTLEWCCGGQNARLSEHDCCLKDSPNDGLFRLEVSRPASTKVNPDRFNSPIRYLFRKTAHEYKAVVDRCRVSPIPIWVDGLKLKSHYHTNPWHLPRKENFPSEAPTGRRKLLAQIPLSGYPGRPPLPYPIDQEPLSSIVSRRERFSPTYFSPPPGQTIRGCVCIYSILQTNSRICYVLDGAIVQEVNYPASAQEGTLALELQRALENGSDNFPLDFYFEVTPSQLDLSHFQVGKEDIDPLLRQSLPFLKEAFQSLRDHCDLPWNFKPWENRMNPIQNTTWGEVATTAFLSPFVGYIALFEGVKVLARPLTKLAQPVFDSRKSRELRPRLQEVLENLDVLLGQGPQNGGSPSR